jgi:hypothetical protein
MNKLILGNYPYKHINFDDVINSFQNNCRFNFHCLNKNNGNITDELAVCSHVYTNIVSVFDLKTDNKKKPFSELYLKYKHAYKKELLEEIYNNFKPSSYSKIYFLNSNRNQINKYLKNIKCPYMYEDSLPRTGFIKVINEVIKGNFVYLSHFTINENVEIKTYITRDDYSMSECHKNSHIYEIKILKWLHTNNFIDLTLCMIEDNKNLTFNCHNLKPSKFILDKFTNKKYLITNLK